MLHRLFRSKRQMHVAVACSLLVVACIYGLRGGSGKAQAPQRGARIIFDVGSLKLRYEQEDEPTESGDDSALAYEGAGDAEGEFIPLPAVPKPQQGRPGAMNRLDIAHGSNDNRAHVAPGDDAQIIAVSEKQVEEEPPPLDGAVVGAADKAEGGGVLSPGDEEENTKLLAAAAAEDAIDPMSGSLRHMSQQAKVYRIEPRVATEEALKPPSDLEAETTFTDIITGALARHVYLDLCGSSLAATRLIPRIYGRPDTTDTLTHFMATLPESAAFQRILGYLRPVKTGYYVFTVGCAGECELYLNPKGASRIGLRRIAHVFAATMPTQAFNADKMVLDDSAAIELSVDRTYAIDLVHKHSDVATVTVTWRLFKDPPTRSILISGTAIALSISERDCHSCNDRFFINRILPSLSGRHPDEHPILQNTFLSSPDPSRPQAPRLPIPLFYSNGPLPPFLATYQRKDLGDRSLLAGLLPECDYDPGYLVKSRIGRYQGHQRIVFTDVFPGDNTTMLNVTGGAVAGTKVMDVSLARLAASRLAEIIALHAAAGETLPMRVPAEQRYSLESISRILKKFDRQKSRIRFFVELTMKRGDGARQFFSEYLYFVPIPPAGTKTYRSMCRPAGVEWERKAFVHLVLPVKNQGQWVQYFVADVNAIYDATGDELFDVTLVDYDSTDINMEVALSRLAVPYRFVKRTGNFERAGGLQAGIEAIGPTDGIVFTCDLHLSMPPLLLDMIRKHTIRGKQAFAPVVARLNCGETPLFPRGFWELSGYGLFSMYRSDFGRMGGMNTTAYKDVRGGEDLEMLDRVLMAGYEVERLRIPYFYHFFTGKRGLWVRAQQAQAPPAATPTQAPTVAIPPNVAGVAAGGGGGIK